MARPKRPRRISGNFGCRRFAIPGRAVGAMPRVALTPDEVEAMRLADVEGLCHEKAGASMRVSRATFGRILSVARNKVALAIVEGFAIEIAEVHVREGNTTPSTGGIRRKKMRRIAVATNDGKTVAFHVGRAKMFAIYTVDEGKAVKLENIANTFTMHGQGAGGHGHGGERAGQGLGLGAGRGQGAGAGLGRGAGRGQTFRDAEGVGPESHTGSHGGLFAVLKDHDCEALITRGLGPRIVQNLNAAGITPIICAEESIEDAADHYAQGTLEEGDLEDAYKEYGDDDE